MVDLVTAAVLHGKETVAVRVMVVPMIVLGMEPRMADLGSKVAVMVDGGAEGNQPTS